MALRTATEEQLTDLAARHEETLCRIASERRRETSVDKAAISGVTTAQVIEVALVIVAIAAVLAIVVGLVIVVASVIAATVAALVIAVVSAIEAELVIAAIAAVLEIAAALAIVVAIEARASAIEVAPVRTVPVVIV